VHFAPTDLALISLIFFAAHLVSTVTGFGSNILGLPLLALIVGIDPAKQSLIVLSAMLYTYLTLRWRRRVSVRELAFIILVTGIGLIVGLFAVEMLNQRLSTILLATFVIAVGVQGLMHITPRDRVPAWATKMMLFLGGVVHGAFTTGGPLLVIYCRRALPHKSTFRATLSVMWLILAIGLMLGWTVGHAWDKNTARLSLLGLPFTLAGLIVGEWLHHRIDERNFRTAVHFTLIAAGVVLLMSNWG
jgi:uncharacterized membrane protein YfcA